MSDRAQLLAAAELLRGWLRGADYKLPGWEERIRERTEAFLTLIGNPGNEAGIATPILDDVQNAVRVAKQAVGEE